MTQQPEQGGDHSSTSRRYERLTATFNYKGFQIIGVVTMLLGAVAYVITYPNSEILGLPLPGIIAFGFALYVGTKWGELAVRNQNQQGK